MPVRKAVANYTDTQSEILRPYLLGLLAEAEFLTGSPESALDALNLAETVTRGLGARLHLPILLVQRGRIATGGEVARSLKRAHEEATKQGATAVAAIAAAELVKLH
jgi:hypothetical protein